MSPPPRQPARHGRPERRPERRRPERRRPPTQTDPRLGLGEREAQARIEARGPVEQPATSRSYASIVRANVLTIFNAILVAFGVITLAFGDWRDALFLAILVVNSGIGIAQEARAKRTLDRLAVLVAPHARLVRDGNERSVGVPELVEGDLVRLQAGDQIVADGELVGADGLRLDESILTGESDAVPRSTGDPVRSGAFVAEGAGAYVVAAVGADSYAERLAGEAREFRHPRSPLENAINRMLLVLVGFTVVFGAVLGYALAHHDTPLRDAVATATAGVVSLVPEGLIVLVSVTYAVASLKMARRGILAQQLNAIESLASADVICIDKTGTLTEASLRVVALIPAPGESEAALAQSAGRLAASSPSGNETLTAIAEAHPGEADEVFSQVPFSSRRRWSGVELTGETLLLGAPERFSLPDALAQAAAREADEGRRVVALASSGGELTDPEDPTAGPPAGARVTGLVVLAEQLRPSIGETIAFLRSEDVEIKVLSGDSPSTVAAIARDAGIDTGRVTFGDEMPDSPDELRRFALETNVIGRISPEGKRRIVEALRDAGHYVAMVGDGVNDVPALKSARLAIAQGNGAQIAKSVADLVLVRGEFGAVPRMLSEGRQALRNLQRVTKLYVTKSSFAAFMILTIGITSTAYPMLPRHFTISAAITIGIPSFFLALAPSRGKWRTEAFGHEVARFAVPAGIIAGTGVVFSYLFAHSDLDLSLADSRTVATTVVVIVGLYLVVALEAMGRMRTVAVSVLCAVLAFLYVLALVSPPSQSFFELSPPSAAIVLTSLFGGAIAIIALYLTGLSPWRPVAVADPLGTPPATVGGRRERPAAETAWSGEQPAETAWSGEQRAPRESRADGPPVDGERDGGSSEAETAAERRPARESAPEGELATEPAPEGELATEPAPGDTGDRRTAADPDSQPTVIRRPEDAPTVVRRPDERSR